MRLLRAQVKTATEFHTGRSTAPVPRYASIVILALLPQTPIAQSQPTISPVATADLHIQAEWRVNAQIEFDTNGRLLILYRDKSKQSPNGNWHLIRITDPLSARPRREEITFSIPQEPVSPKPTERWNFFSSDLAVSPEGNFAYATFNGHLVTEKAGPSPATGGRNVSVANFSSVVSFDLSAFRVVASADVTEGATRSTAHQMDTKGNLLLVYQLETDWKIVVLDEALHQTRTETISMAPVANTLRYSCQLRPDVKMECPTYGGGDLLLDPQFTIQLPRLACKTAGRLVSTEFGKDQTQSNGFIQSDHLCLRSESGQETLVSPDLLPRCHQGWQPSAISPHHRSLLTSCYESGLVLDTFYTSKARLQLVDALTLVPRATIALSNRHRETPAVFHASGMTTIAVLEDGFRLLLYSLLDQSTGAAPKQP